MQRAAEMDDEILFKQPESSHLGDCPICFLPMPLNKNARRFRDCCGKMLCLGCAYANDMFALKQGHEAKCPFCREKDASSEEESMKRLLRRAEANDPIALASIGQSRYDEEDYENAFRYYTRAAEEGSEDARFRLGAMYCEGEFVEKNEDECIYHWANAAIWGHAGARYTLGMCEWVMERFDRAVKHWIISASLGDNESIKRLTKMLQRRAC